MDTKKENFYSSVLNAFGATTWNDQERSRFVNELKPHALNQGGNIWRAVISNDLSLTIAKKIGLNDKKLAAFERYLTGEGSPWGGGR